MDTCTLYILDQTQLHIPKHEHYDHTCTLRTWKQYNVSIYDITCKNMYICTLVYPSTQTIYMLAVHDWAKIRYDWARKNTIHTSTISTKVKMKLTINKHAYGETPDNIEKDRKSLKKSRCALCGNLWIFAKKNQQLENIETVVLNSTQNSKCLNFISYLKKRGELSYTHDYCDNRKTKKNYKKNWGFINTIQIKMYMYL